MLLAPLHPLVLPIAIAIWSIDAFLWIVLIRLSLSRARSQAVREAVWALTVITDPAHHLLRNGLDRLQIGRCTPLMSWTALIALLILARCLLVWLVLSTH